MPKIYLYSEKIELVNFFDLNKREIYLDNIKSYGQKKFNSKYNSYEILYLNLMNGRVLSLNCDMYEDFNQLKLKLLKHKSKDYEFESKLEIKENKKTITLSIIISIISFILVGFIICRKNNLIDESYMAIIFAFIGLSFIGMSLYYLKKN